MQRKRTISFSTGFSCCAFLYFNRGTSKSKEAMAFRRWFYKLSELRSLVPNKIPFMAVTATATRQTKDIITSVLRFGNFEEVSESPNKANICYSVQTMDKRTPLLQYFQWILNELKEKKGGTERTIIYCQTIKQCSTLYSLFVQEMGDLIFATDSKDPRQRLIEMLHALSSKSNKEVVLQEMGQEAGCIRVLICTIAFGMGVNCKGVQRVIHLGPSKSVEAYIQESGRAGRDGSPSKALLLYQPLMLLHVEKDMKDYVKGKYTCRRGFLMGHFEEKGRKSPRSQTQSDFVCCDLCSKDEKLKVHVPAPAPYAGKTRTVSRAQKTTLKGMLIRFRKSLLVELLHQSPKGELPVASVPELLIGFSDHQILQVLENCDKIFSVSDVKANVEIWKERHAYAIMDILAEVFKDCHQDTGHVHDQDYFDEDDEEDDDWNELFNDSELMDVDWDNLSTSNILCDDSTFLEESQDVESGAMYVPELGDLIEKVQIE